MLAITRAIASRKIALAILSASAFFFISLVFGEEAPKGKLPFDEKTDEGLELRFSPILNDNGMPVAVYGMLFNAGSKPVRVKTSAIYKGYFFGNVGVKETKEGDRTVLGINERKSNMDHAPCEYEYILEQNAFVGLMATFTERSRQSLKDGQLLHAVAVVDLTSGFADGDESAMKKYRLVGSADFPIHEYKTAQNGASKVKTAK